MKEIKAPGSYEGSPRPWVFLAGSIDMGKALLWQDEVVARLKACEGTVLNPRREDWDETWVQSISNATFREQVEWELHAQEMADLILFYFQPGSFAPITLLEFGLFHGPRIVVCCPDGYQRKGNVDIVCHRYGIRTAETLVDLAAFAQSPIQLQCSEKQPRCYICDGDCGFYPPRGS